MKWDMELERLRDPWEETDKSQFLSQHFSCCSVAKSCYDYAHGYGKLISYSFVTPRISPPGSSVHGISQARILERVAIFFLQGIFPTQGSKSHLLHWQGDYLPLSQQGSPALILPTPSLDWLTLSCGHCVCSIPVLLGSSPFPSTQWTLHKRGAYIAVWMQAAWGNQAPQGTDAATWVSFHFVFLNNFSS